MDGDIDVTESASFRSSKKVLINFKWPPIKSRFLLAFLANEARQGYKLERGFKGTSITAAVEAVKTTFNEPHVNDSHIHNHLRHLRNRWRKITELKKKGRWVEDEKKIIMDENAYISHMQLYPKDEPYINKVIEEYEDLSLVCGSELAVGHLSKQGSEPLGINHEQPAFDVPENVAGLDTSNNSVEFVETSETSQSHNIHAPGSSSSRRVQKSNRKRTRDAEVQVMEELVATARELVATLQTVHTIQFSEKLYEQVMTMQGEYEKASLARAYEYLLDHPTPAKAFMVQDNELRKSWLDRFFWGDH